MTGIPLTILGLAAGIYLLIQVKHYGFGGIYKALAWLVILLSLASMAFGITRGIIHHRHMGYDIERRHCDMRIGGTNACPYMSSGHCSMGPGAGCYSKDSGAAGMKCDMGKPSCCAKGTPTATDTTAHK